MKYFKVYGLLSRLFLALAFFFMNSSLLAEEFLEEIYADPDNVGQGKEEEKKLSESSSDEVASSASKWSFSLGIGGNLASFYGSFQANYHYNKYVVPQIVISYRDVREDDYRLTDTQLDFPVVLYVANPTLFWPFVGAGLGFHSWKQKDDFGVFDDNNSLSGFYLYGLRLKFNQNFSLVFTNTTTTLFSQSPVVEIKERSTDQEELIREERTKTEFSYQFIVSF
ncbi:MAG: hypothetical protein R3B45_08735 [Bdellovibrionota bacterium]